ncbi:hypothetical protein JXZ92_00540 [Mycoplasma sp. CSL10137]|uniref:MAGa3780 family membrane protein n=1 Tax=unclassified Mycoplasma TaxID=2683645 RepID=UPI00197BC7E0|nr:MULTISPECIES: hypothetical protein [unclassified Mycoplasma]MBN4083310.1 hypothetical protein [Mycoplasma sp. CSL10137]MBU4692873.1 hypothetical protein [Mycoplasma sp. CSL7491-lung]
MRIKVKLHLSHKSKNILTFIIGIILIFLYISTVVWEWNDRTDDVWDFYHKNPEIIREINKLANNESDFQKQRIIYENILPNAVNDLWGGSTHWFTFMSNVLMAVSILLLPFYHKSLIAHKIYFSSMIYIIIVVIVFWSGTITDSTILGYMSKNDIYRTIIWHVIGPLIGLSTLCWERKKIKISNKTIWVTFVFPVLYLIFASTIYFVSYKYNNFNSLVKLPPLSSNNFPNDVPQRFNREIDRGIAIYSIISFQHPLGYRGSNIYFKVINIILIVLFSFLTSPIIGFILRRVLRIRQPHENNLPKVWFVSPTSYKGIKKQTKEENKK